MHNYPSDITREQFEIIRSDLENAKKKTVAERFSELEIGLLLLHALVEAR